MSNDDVDNPLRAALQAWSVAFNACDVEKVTALYAPDAMLWGTVSQALISSPEGIREYFQRACSTNPPPKVVLADVSVRTQGESAVSSGTYTFTLTLQGQARTLPARFSFAYRRSGQGWLITSHHSVAHAGATCAFCTLSLASASRLANGEASSPARRSTSPPLTAPTSNPPSDDAQSFTPGHLGRGLLADRRWSRGGAGQQVHRQRQGHVPAGPLPHGSGSKASHSRRTERRGEAATRGGSLASPTKPAPAAAVASGGFACDGRQYCSQMKSCNEAKYFLAHCPGVKMDGDNNGIRARSSGALASVASTPRGRDGEAPAWRLSR